jgi:PAS domain S-box-containing protein
MEGEPETEKEVFFPGPVQKESTEFRVLAYIIALTAIISYFDIVTPQGFTIWILYLIPLFLTLYVRWQYAPFTATGIFIILMSISFFLSPVDISPVFAASDRIFFALALVTASYFIYCYNRNVSALRKHEIRYRQLAESSPDTLVVLQGKKIVYINPAGLRFFGADHCNDIINSDFYSHVIPGQWDHMQNEVAGTLQGKRTPFYRTRLIRLDTSQIQAEALNEKILWDGEPAVQIILREALD